MKITAAALVTVVGVALAVSHAFAHGELDQRLLEPTNCSAENFPVTFDASTNPRQEFVPSGSLLASVQVCVGSTIPEGTTLTVVVREGSADDPGDVLGEDTVPISLIEAWPSHADYDPLVRLKPGKTYVLEVRAEEGVFWRGIAEDRYCAGSSNVTAGDLSFMTYDSVRGSPDPRTCEGGDSSSSVRGWMIAAGAAAAGLGIAGGLIWRWRRSVTVSQRSDTAV